MSIPEHVPVELVIDFDVYDDNLADNIHEILREVRAKTPVAYTEHNEGHWIVTRYEDVRRVYSDPAQFSSVPGVVPASRGMDPSTRLLPSMSDPPEHTAYREMIAPLFAMKRMQDLEIQIRHQVGALIDDIEGQPECEFVSAFASPLPSTVFLLLMGWPLDDGPQFLSWSHELLTGVPGGTPEQNAAVIGAATAKVYAYFDSIIQDRRANPSDDYTSQIVHTLYEGERQLTDNELQRMLTLLMHGGLHTVQSSLASAVTRLATHRDEQDALRYDPTLIRPAVEEMLRWDPPVWSSRRVTKDVVVGGVKMRAGDMILLSVPGANRDESEFSEPDGIDFTRRSNRHMTFALGVHRCIGSHLARIELGIAFEELHRRLPAYRLDPEYPPRRHLGMVSGFHELRIRFD